MGTKRFGKLTLKEQSSIDSFKFFSRVSELTHVPASVEDKAKALYQDSKNLRTFASRKLTDMTAACFHLACLQQQVPRSLPEICEVFGSDKKFTAKIEKDIEKCLNLDLPPDYSERYLPRVCGLLIKPSYPSSQIMQVESNARSLLEASARGNVACLPPQGVQYAVASMLIACDLLQVETIDWAECVHNAGCSSKKLTGMSEELRRFLPPKL
eukprot:Lithocolla_globosa_v1_NODE_3452_length_1668_cov_9.719255.p1 type:complete len:212 gc:universal NODE_3452_length_1668_cov_9.719255:852-1487(+)